MRSRAPLGWGHGPGSGSSIAGGAGASMFAVVPHSCSVHGSIVTSYFGMERSFGASVGVLLAYWGALHVVSFVALLLAARRERR
jgi:hypothetical protein